MLTNLPDKIYRFMALGLIAFVAVIVFMTFKDYGITWDEELQSSYGQAVFNYYASGFTDRGYNQIFNLHLYGGMFDGLAAIVNEFTPITIYETRHFLNAMVGLLGLWGTWRLGRLIGGGFVGVTAMALLAIVPMYYGHMFNNPKDIPFAVGVVWSLYYMAKTYMAYPNISRRLMIKLGIVFGLTLGVRVNGIMVFGFWGIMLLWHAWRSLPKRDLQHVGVEIKRIAKLAAPVALIAYVVMLVCWPWAQEAPISNPMKAITEFSNFPQIVEVILNGKVFLSNNLPWYYLPLYFGVQLPALHLFMLALSLFMLIEIAAKMSARGKRSTIGLLLLTIIAPSLYAILGGPALYDAVRHFIFILPPLCIIAALVVKKLMGAVYDDMEPGTSMVTKWAFAFLAVVLALGPVASMIRLHPYQYVYLNEAVGGVEGGYGRYELDYWGSSFKEAAEQLQAYVNAKGPYAEHQTYKVAICGPWSAITQFLPPNYTPVYANLEADFFVSTTRWMCQNMRKGHEIVRIQRQNAPLSIVEDVRGFPLPN